MFVNLYSICDSVAKEFGPIYCCKNEEVAIRAYRELIKDTDSPFDYDLYLLGMFDTEKGTITSLVPSKVPLVSFSDDVSKENLFSMEEK